LNTFYINKSQIKDNNIQISGDDFHHIKNVLRLKKGEEIYVCDEVGSRYLVNIDEYFKDYVNLKIVEKYNDPTESKVNITLFQGLPKQDKMELIIQKGTELGVKSFVPIVMERSIVKIDDKSSDKKLERWQKIAKEAARTKSEGRKFH